MCHYGIISRIKLFALTGKNSDLKPSLIQTKRSFSPTSPFTVRVAYSTQNKQ